MENVRTYRSEVYVPRIGMYSGAWYVNGNDICVYELTDERGEDCVDMMWSVPGFRFRLFRALRDKTSKIKSAHETHSTPRHLGGY